MNSGLFEAFCDFVCGLTFAGTCVWHAASREAIDPVLPLATLLSPGTLVLVADTDLLDGLQSKSV